MECMEHEGQGGDQPWMGRKGDEKEWSMIMHMCEDIMVKSITLQVKLKNKTEVLCYL